MSVDDRARAVAETLRGWDQGSAPLYVALADAVASALATRRIAPHLPSERALASALHVSRGTVAASYEILRDRGLLERQRGSGSVAAASRAHETCTDPLECVRSFFALS